MERYDYFFGPVVKECDARHLEMPEVGVVGVFVRPLYVEDVDRWIWSRECPAAQPPVLQARPHEEQSRETSQLASLLPLTGGALVGTLSSVLQPWEFLHAHQPATA